MRMFLAKRLQPPRCTTFFRGITNSSISRLSSFDIHPEVQDALSSGKPVVALESALITHGFPPTESPALALSLEKSVRSTGSIPATIAVLKGRVKIGLEPRELDLLVSEPAVKVSRRDIGPAIALKANGGTTICSTSIFAAKAGIKIFATGGLGGVHRGGEISMDVSADLPELTRNQVAVVSAGVKSILDIRRTLEYLETLGVPVVAYSKRPDFPAFFGARSGFQVPWNTDDPQKIAEILFAQWNGLNLENGALIAVPIPEEHEARAAEIQACVDQAVAESESNGVARSGKDVTPWLLNRVKELTHGQSKESNIALLHNTAIVGGQIAVQYQKLLGNREPV
ncbi:pseudouridine 5'-phosphate glycosidase, partial [Flagelloscypha sp. PMI_526]